MPTIRDYFLTLIVCTHVHPCDKGRVSCVLMDLRTVGMHMDRVG